MYPQVFDFKDYFTVAGVAFTLLLIAFFLAWFIYDLKTSTVSGKDKKNSKEQTEPENSFEDFKLDKKFLYFITGGVIAVYGLYFVLYWSCRVFHSSWIGMVYWILVGLYVLALLAYICYSEWYHVETKYNTVSFYKVLTGHPLTKKLREMEKNTTSAAEKGGE